MRLICFYQLLMWISCVCSTRHHDARVTDTDKGITRYSIKHNHSGFIKLIRDSNSWTIWAGDHKTLYQINTAEDKQVNVPLPKDKCKEISDDTTHYTISLLTEGVDGNLLFLCETFQEQTICSNMNSSYCFVDCFSFSYGLYIDDPSLIVGDFLFFAKSNVGLYRINRKNKYDKIWAETPVTEKYVKLVAGNGQHRDKVYSFFIEKDSSNDLWSPRVSQFCMNDKGGPKANLQNSWTSMIYANLSCDSVAGEHPFTKLIDVATVQTDDDIRIYALFRNYWNMSAVCVYSLTEITNIFETSAFAVNTAACKDHRPGTCVSDSTTLSGPVLKIMKERPQMKDSIEPQKSPLLFPHHHYTHIQVDRVQNRTVLLLALESGGVHKVLENPADQPTFIIAEFRPFPRGTRVTSMLLDSPEKRLYVSSGNEVLHIDLQRCDLYGNDCNDCILSRDPYCGWNGSHCAPVTETSIQDRKKCSSPVASPSRTEREATASVLKIPRSSRSFLLCSTTSHHASYRWYRGNTQLECVRTERGCLYLIESMNKTHEGLYRCSSSEGDYHRIITQYELSMSASPTHTVSTILITCVFLLCLIS